MTRCDARRQTQRTRMTTKKLGFFEFRGCRGITLPIAVVLRSMAALGRQIARAALSRVADGRHGARRYRRFCMRDAVWKCSPSTSA